MNDAAKIRRLSKKAHKIKSPEKMRKLMLESLEIAKRNENNKLGERIMSAFDFALSPD